MGSSHQSVNMNGHYLVLLAMVLCVPDTTWATPITPGMRVTLRNIPRRFPHLGDWSYYHTGQAYYGQGEMPSVGPGPGGAPLLVDTTSHLRPIRRPNYINSLWRGKVRFFQCLFGGCEEVDRPAAATNEQPDAIAEESATRPEESLSVIRPATNVPDDSLTCKSVAPYQGASMDAWCQNNCVAGNCPATHCSCDNAQTIRPATNVPHAIEERPLPVIRPDINVPESLQELLPVIRPAINLPDASEEPLPVIRPAKNVPGLQEDTLPVIRPATNVPGPSLQGEPLPTVRPATNVPSAQDEPLPVIRPATNVPSAQGDTLPVIRPASTNGPSAQEDTLPVIRPASNIPSAQEDTLPTIRPATANVDINVAVFNRHDVPPAIRSPDISASDEHLPLIRAATLPDEITTRGLLPMETSTTDIVNTPAAEELPVQPSNDDKNLPVIRSATNVSDFIRSARRVSNSTLNKDRPKVLVRLGSFNVQDLIAQKIRLKN